MFMGLNEMGEADPELQHIPTATQAACTVVISLSKVQLCRGAAP